MPSEQWRKQFVERQLQRCKHFNGSSSVACRAGVAYHDLVGNEPGWGCKLPCTGDKGCDRAPELAVVPCALREYPTPEEVEADVRRITERANGSIKARQAITDYLKARQAITDYLKANNKPLRRVAGNIPCPVCDGGTLHFSIASNGHCHAKCSTPGCMNWME